VESLNVAVAASFLGYMKHFSASKPAGATALGFRRGGAGGRAGGGGGAGKGGNNSG